MTNDFGWALAAMKNGHQVRRGHDHPGWAPGVVIDIARPDTQTDESFMRIVSLDGKRRPWTPGHWDLLAEDWMLADG